MLDGLYNTDVLTLSAHLKTGTLQDAHGTVRKVSKLCGSWIELDVIMDNGVVFDTALRIEACALGQASAAILQQTIIGASLREVTAARDGLRAMLKSGGAPPLGRFSKLALLSGVRAYPARHNSTLLAFDAAVEAIEIAEGQA
ncbi:iron-sulfur cluster assembly scaffold protein [Fretibacter rubidus]|uniref:iron-sulfur cluster assembly scaffold protein n=1 Tax=Fretibacter rubidus TaxID=570162 RepID=UPI00352BACBC